MALTRLSGANAITGTIPSTNIANASLNSVTALPAGVVTEGVKVVDVWRQTTTTSINAGAVRYGITANWERSDTFDPGFIGTGMSESSGIFSFPQTGIWQVSFHAEVYRVSAALRSVNVDIIYTSDNSSYDTIATGRGNIHSFSGNSCHISSISQATIDVTDISNQKVKFGVWDQDSADGTLMGVTNGNITFVIFTRIGDT